jgi:hypothetical protein
VLSRITSASDDVRAPVSGQLMVFDTFGAPRLAPVGYASIVAIYDSASRLVVTLLHVMPTPALASITAPVPITKGAIVGSLAPPSLNNFPAVHEFHHTHLNVIDGRSKKLLDPVPLFAAYKDTVKPSVEAVYLLDELAARSDALRTGRLDVVVDAFDRDDESARNLEVAAIAYAIKDGHGNVLRSSPRCNLRELFESIASPYSERALSLVDFGNALSQRDNTWPNADLGNLNRRFRYVLTHLAVKDGRCTTLDDADGYLDVADDVSRLDVHVTLWDPSGNVREHDKSIARDPNAHDPPRRLVTFEVENATTFVGQNVYVVGDAPQIGSWNPRRASKLSPSAYPTWTGKAWLPVGAPVNLKFIKIAPGAEPGWDSNAIPDQRVTWESGANRSVTIPQAPAPAVVHATWR